MGGGATMTVVTIDLAVPRRSWGFFAIFFGVLGVPSALAGVGLLIAAAASQSAGPLVGGVLGALFAWVTLPSAVLAARIARSATRIVVDAAGITIEDLGVLSAPLRISRQSIHSVYVGSSVGPTGVPRWFNAQSMVSSWYAPDVSLRWATDANLLIVLAEPLELRPTARYGLGLLGYATARGHLYWGPTRWTIARGFFAKVRDVSAARTAFTGWPTASEPPEEVMAWLRGPRASVRH
jgi:hypothetical protein